MPAVTAPRHTRKTQEASALENAVRVREMLREIAFVLHATRVVGRVAPKKG